MARGLQLFKYKTLEIMKASTLEKLKKGEHFQFSDKPNAKIYVKESGGKKIHRFTWVEDFCSEQETKNGKRKVFTDIEY